MDDETLYFISRVCQCRQASPNSVVDEPFLPVPDDHYILAGRQQLPQRGEVRHLLRGVIWTEILADTSTEFIILKTSAFQTSCINHVRSYRRHYTELLPPTWGSITASESEGLKVQSAILS